MNICHPKSGKQKKNDNCDRYPNKNQQNTRTNEQTIYSLIQPNPKFTLEEDPGLEVGKA
jgi:hypothetical protein